MESFKDQVSDLIARHRHRVDYLAVRLEKSQGCEIRLRAEALEALSEGVAVGGQVRACYRGGWGFASFNRLSDLSARMEDAIAAARLVGGDTTQLAPIDIIQTTCRLPLTGTDPRDISLADKKTLCHHYIDVLQGEHPEIISTAVRYEDSYQQVLIATSEGTLIEQSWTDLEMRFSATARQGEKVQTGRETVGSRRAYEDVLGLEDQVKAAGDRAVNALTLPPAKGGIYTIVIDPILSGLFVHEAFGHLSEADMIYENPELLETMSLGRRFGPQNLQIFDGAAPLGHRGSYLYDDEGTPATTTQLIKDGVLTGRLHSRETAGELGEAPTGNARCLSYHYSPLVRMTNTWIERGETPVTDLFSGIDEGIYARNWIGGQTNGELFTFTAGEAWMIRKGEVAEPIQDVTLSGNVFSTLANIEAIGDDFYWDESGGCGKGGQSGLAVGCGGPSLRIKDVVIGGESE
ncbi:TldD/PmbA family [Synechococcus sp. PCC 7335]|uniref:TldD/PmbA family protein n=1 Tax=Synechococcus sp. (strain ATCC 29403 / PCC 7335) TaxID=91464 RepID=UPI00017ED63D|nr:TldD/PmbA family [Synechococcus sp. PCC 7335]